MVKTSRHSRITRQVMHRLIAGIIVVATVLFTLGVAVERGMERGEGPGTHQEAGEGVPHEGEEAPQEVATSHEESGAAHTEEESAGEASHQETGEAHTEEASAGEAAHQETGEVSAETAHPEPETAHREMLLGFDLENP
jgi:hypothetical protein